MAICLAIHHVQGTFSDRWLQYCSERKISATVIDCHRSDALERLRPFHGLLWAFSHTVPADVLCARYVIRSAEMMGLEAFPNTSTCWHYDDKIAQKYLLEAIDAPLVPTHVFYDLDKALQWVDQTTFPKVFKLRKGAGSRNVRLVRSPTEARSLVRKSFHRGFKPISGYLTDAHTKLRRTRRQGTLLETIKRMPSTLAQIRRINMLMGREAGYVYFQDFIPDNKCDTRVTVIGDRAFAFTRRVRPNDFRASGSGSIDYDKATINPKCLSIAFEVAGRIAAQSLAFDFVQDAQGQPLITEISYCYVAEAVHACQGYWDHAMNWHEGQVWPQDAILGDLLANCRMRLGEKS